MFFAYATTADKQKKKPQRPFYEFKSQGVTLYTNSADFESTRGATMVGG